MKKKLVPALILMAIMLLCLPQWACQNNTTSENAIDYVTETSGDVDFGKTNPEAYTPAIRENMEKLYHDKIGLFVHWGPYAQLEGYWDDKKVTGEWIMKRAFIPIEDYEREAAGKFKPVNFSAREWVDIAENAGMKFIVVTAKHHDGFAMYNSAHPYNLVDFAGFGRDMMKELSLECAQRDMNLGFYYSQSQDWHEEGAWGNTWDYPYLIPDSIPKEKADEYYHEKVVPQLKELTQNYGDIFMVWFDTPINMKDWQCENLMEVVKENQPGALVNSRLGNGYGHFDVSIDNGKTPSVSTASWLPDLKVPWQTHESVTQGGWGYTAFGGENDRSEDYSEFIYSLCNIVCNGGVYLLNVGPRPDGTIPPSQVNSLRAIGEWLEVNGESIYGADPSPLKFPPYAITSKPGMLYLHMKDMEQNQVELTGILSKVKKAYCLADNSQQALEFTQKKENLSITVPDELIQPKVTVVVLEIADEEAKIIDETLQQESDGVLKLPVAKCEFATRRTSYDYKTKVTHRWGENAKQGLIWTVNITKPGEFKVISEDNGNANFQYELRTEDGTLLLNALGDIGEMSRKEQDGKILISQKGTQRITIYPKVTDRRNRYQFKGVELVPVN